MSGPKQTTAASDAKSRSPSMRLRAEEGVRLKASGEALVALSGCGGSEAVALSSGRRSWPMTAMRGPGAGRCIGSGGKGGARTGLLGCSGGAAALWRSGQRLYRGLTMWPVQGGVVGKLRVNVAITSVDEGCVSAPSLGALVVTTPLSCACCWEAPQHCGISHRGAHERVVPHLPPSMRLFFAFFPHRSGRIYCFVVSARGVLPHLICAAGPQTTMSRLGTIVA